MCQSKLMCIYVYWQPIPLRKGKYSKYYKIKIKFKIEIRISVVRHYSKLSRLSIHHCFPTNNPLESLLLSADLFWMSVELGYCSWSMMFTDCDSAISFSASGSIQVVCKSAWRTHQEANHFKAVHIINMILTQCKISDVSVCFVQENYQRHALLCPSPPNFAISWKSRPHAVTEICCCNIHFKWMHQAQSLWQCEVLTWPANMDWLLKRE